MQTTKKIVTQYGVDGIRLDTPEWFEWLHQHDSFRYEDSWANVHYWCQKKRGYWYAFKTINDNRRCQYIGKIEACTKDRLEQIKLVICASSDRYYEKLRPRRVIAIDNTEAIMREKIKKIIANAEIMQLDRVIAALQEILDN